MPSSLQVELLSQPSYTPPRRELAALIALYLESSEPSHEQIITTALRRTPGDAFAQAMAQLAQTRRPARARLVALCGKLLGTLAAQKGDATPIEDFLPLIFDDDATAARQAVQAIGKLPAGFSPRVEPQLLKRLAQTSDAADLRALAEVLGKLGGERALVALRNIPRDDKSPLLAQIVERALLRGERSHERAKLTTPPTVHVDRLLPPGQIVVLRCRAGLSAIVEGELRARGVVARETRISASEPQTLGQRDFSGQPGRVSFVHDGPLSSLFAVRTWSSLSLALPFPPGASKSADLGDLVTAALTSDKSRALFSALSGESGPVRYRLHFADGGHRRALVLRIAAAVRKRAPELLNDPTDSPFSVEISENSPDGPAIELLPRFSDPRFAYHLRDVPAASHPPIAAALARLAEAGADDVVWDPFTGSGSELIEVALSSPCRRLFGTDLDPEALAIARGNITAAGFADDIRLKNADALGFSPTLRPTRIVTNPPMGRRTRPGQLSAFLTAFLEHVAKLLPPGGRLVYISPQPRMTTHVAESLKLQRLSVRPIDLNGFWGSLEVWQKAQ